jgi:hypothetical protein
MKPLLLCTIALALLAGTSLQAGDSKSCCAEKAKGSAKSAKSSCCAEKVVKKADTSVKGATLLVRR